MVSAPLAVAVWTEALTAALNARLISLLEESLKIQSVLAKAGIVGRSRALGRRLVESAPLPADATR